MRQQLLYACESIENVLGNMTVDLLVAQFQDLVFFDHMLRAEQVLCLSALFHPGQMTFAVRFRPVAAQLKQNVNLVYTYRSIKSC